MGNGNQALPGLAAALKKLGPALSEVAEVVQTLAAAAEVQTAQNKAESSDNPEINAKASKSTHSKISAEDDTNIKDAAEKPAEDDLKPSDEGKKAAPTDQAAAGSVETRVLPPLADACATPLPHHAPTAVESREGLQKNLAAEGLNAAVKSEKPSEYEVTTAKAERMSLCTQFYKQLVHLGWTAGEARAEAQRVVADVCINLGAPVTQAGQLPYELHEAFVQGLNAKLYEVRK